MMNSPQAHPTYAGKKAVGEEERLFCVGLNPMHAGKTLPDTRRYTCKGVQNTFTFPHGASKRCPPTVTRRSLWSVWS